MNEANKIGQATDQGEQGKPGQPRRPWSWREVGLVVLLMLGVAGLRAWQISQTKVASRDSIAFIHYAWLLDHEPWTKVLRAAPRHPGYPVAVWAVAKVVRGCWAGPEPLVMQWSAQLTSALVSVLLVIPLYGLGRAWFGRVAGAGAVLLFQGLPTGSLVLADGLSEGLFLLWAVAALWAVTVGLRDRSPFAMALGGLFSGVAYLVRPEGALILAATGVVLISQQIIPARRQPLRRFLASAGCLALSGFAVALPLILATGKLTSKTSVNIILKDSPEANNDGPVFPTPYLPCPHQLRALNKLLPPTETPTDSPPDQRSAAIADAENPSRGWSAGLVPGTVELGWELLEGMGYFVWLPALVGAWTQRRRLREITGTWVLILVGLGILLFTWRVAVVAGYLSERHLLLIVLGSSLWAAAGLAALAHGLSALARGHVDHRLVFSVLLIGMLVPFLGRSLQPMHADRASYRDAGFWLAEHCGADDVVVDPHCWAAFYAGRAFRLDDGFAPTPASRTVFVVLDGSATATSHLLTVPLARQLATRGEIVYRGGESQGKSKSGAVVVYAVPLPANR